jgi:hypothetical protein
MLKAIRTSLIATFVFGLSLFAVQAVTPSAYAVAAEPGANIQDNLCKGAKDLQFSTSDAAAGTNATCADDTNAKGLNDLITAIINILSVIVGIIAVIMIIFGGFRYITSGGDSGNVTSAKNTILYAIVGLVIVALAQFIVKFVLNKATGL